MTSSRSRSACAAVPACAVFLVLGACTVDTTSTEPEATVPRVAPFASDGGADAAPTEFPGFDAGDFPGISFAKPLPAQLQLLSPPAKTPPPLAGGSLAVTGDGSYAIVADADRDVVHSWERATFTVRRVALPAGSEPSRSVIDGRRRAHVVLRGTGEVARIDPALGTLLGTAKVCAEPRGVAYDAASDRISVACASGRLVSMRADDYTAQSEVALPSDLRDVLADGKGGFKISRYRSAELLTVAGGSVAVRHGGLAARSSAELGIGIDGPAAVTRSAAVAWRAVAGPADSVWMLHQQSQNEPVSDTQPGGYSANCAPVTTAAITAFDAAGNAQGAIPVALNGLAVDVAISPDGKLAAVASPGGYLQGTPTLSVYDTSVSMLPVAAGEGAVEANPCNQAPSATDCAGQQITSVAFDARGSLYAFARDPSTLLVFSVSADVSGLPVLAAQGQFALAADSVRDTGHDLFHLDVGSGLSCAACHGEATDDGHVWHFESSGARRTQSLRGGILSSAPYHWSGDLPDVQHLLDEVMTRRMGGFAVPSEYAVALGNWLDAQPAQREDVADAAAVARGKALFDSTSVGCRNCHGGARFTNFQSANVGTGGVFQVPSLLGLATRPPYMHDGCAATIAARFDPGCGGGDLHGQTSTLPPNQLGDLVAYLASL